MSSVREIDALRWKKRNNPYCEKKNLPKNQRQQPNRGNLTYYALPCRGGIRGGTTSLWGEEWPFHRQSRASARHYLTKHSLVEIAEQSINPNPSVKLSFIVHPCKVQRKYVNLPTRITYYDKKYITHHKLEPATLGCYSLQSKKENQTISSLR